MGANIASRITVTADESTLDTIEQQIAAGLAPPGTYNWDNWSLAYDARVGGTTTIRLDDDILVVLFSSRSWENSDTIATALVDIYDTTKVENYTTCYEYGTEISKQIYSNGDYQTYNYNPDNPRDILDHLSLEQIDQLEIDLCHWFSETGPGGQDTAGELDDDDWSQIDLSNPWTLHTVKDYYSVDNEVELVKAILENNTDIQGYYIDDDDEIDKVAAEVTLDDILVVAKLIK